MKIEVSNGEIVDKFTILRIKESNIKDKSKLNNIKNELDELLPYVKSLGIVESTSNTGFPYYQDILNDIQTSEYYHSLLDVNKKLWKIEDDIRDKEKRKEFDDEFINVARSVYFLNDKRAKVKKQINEKTNSNLVEEKSYSEIE